VVAQEPVLGVQPPDVVRTSYALQPKRLAVAQPRRLGRHEGVEPVEHDDDAAVGDRELLEEARERVSRRGGEGLQHGHEVRREGGGRGRVRRRRRVRRDLEVVELDGAEGLRILAVHARARPADVRPGRRVVHGQAPRREQQRQVQHAVQVALRRQWHRHDGNRFHRVNRH
jgi:hypothetical protein